MTPTYHCRRGGSTNIVKNGTNKCRHPQYHCKNCSAYRLLEQAPNTKKGMVQFLKEIR